jgi:threonine-phosphate decarboxylase
MQGFNKLSYFKTYPTEVNYMLVKILLDDITARDIQERLLKQGILIRDCSSFVGLGDNFFRIAVRKRVENVFLLDSMSKMLTNMQL